MQWRLILDSLGTGLPVLMLHLAATLLLLGVGIAGYMAITPFHERRLVAAGNPAAGMVLGGTVIALALPLAATLATSTAALDILIWGAVAVLFQLIAFAVAALLVRDLRAQIEAGNTAAAMTQVGIQIAFALINAAAMAG
ncbi:MAG: DUF350 domain-containing protein [Rhodospirillaceae bacterium]|nr:DUF350 domain-containing protein [Rhodospirillales bacterium]